MKLLHPIALVFISTLFSGNIFAAAYKCTDENGKIAYQASPCAQEKRASEFNISTGNTTDLSIAEKQKAFILEQEIQQKLEKKLNLEKITSRKQQAIKESALNQQLIKDQSSQFSAFAIPPYIPDDLPPLIKQYESRLPEIEKFRRLAALKALESGQCVRVESDQLSIQSTLTKLVFSIDCSTAKIFYFTETELSTQ